MAITKKRKRVRNMPSPNPHTLVGRIDLMLERRGQRRKDFNAAVGIGEGVLAQHARRGTSLSGANLEKAARYLGVSPEWLRRGDELQVVPVANGKPPAVKKDRAAASMSDSLSTTMHSLWGLLPEDVQAFVIARMAELLASNAAQAQRRGG